MQGVILNVGEARSLILGDDGQRYAFTPTGWGRDDVQPQIGMRVDFEVRGSEAVDVYPIPDAATTPGAAPAEPPASPTADVPATPTPTPPATDAPATPPPTAPDTPPTPPDPPSGDSGGRRRLYWALAGVGALVVVVVVAFALGIFGSSGPPVGEEIARHTHEGQVYVLVEYGDELAVFSGSGAPVTQRSLAEDVLRSYAWGQVVAGLDTGKLAGVSERVRRLDDGVSDARRLSNGVTAIFDELDGLKANIPILGSISAMDVVRDSFDGVEEAEALIRALDSELNALGQNAASLSRASDAILRVDPSAASGREMESLFAEASGAARDLESTVQDVKGFVSDAADAAADLESALRAGSGTPVIGGTLGNFAWRVGRFESAASGLSGLMGEFESELGALAQDMEDGIDSAGKTLQADLDRWLADPYDAEWPPANPERRPDGIARAPAASSAPTSQATERRPAEVARAAAPANTPEPEPTSAPAPTAMPTNTPIPAPTAVPTRTSAPTPIPVPTNTPTPVPPPTNTPTPAAERIAFSSDRAGNEWMDIYVMNVDGSDVTRLTSIGGRSPSWSPDGRRIAFDSDVDGDYEIFVMNADGSGVTQLTDNEASDWKPRWSPDGRRIVFRSTRDRASSEIYVMNVDGSDVTRLTHNNWQDWHPTWSPDSRRIAFFTLGKVASDDMEIYVMNADGSGVRQLTDNEWQSGFPSWSPDGRHIAFLSSRGRDWKMYVMNADGSGVTRLTSVGGTGSQPSWSPDGRRIAFTSYRDGDWEIFVMNADGSGVTQLTHTGGDHPSWGPGAR